jgi:TP901 family phage tail tape measure protein
MSKVRGGQVFVEIGADSKRFFKALSDVQKGIGKIGSSMRALGSRMAAIGAGIALPVGLAVRQFAAFDDAIRATAAVSQASGAELQKLNDKARELGATTSFTAIQVANLMTELGRAGFKPDEINDMTAAVLDLARATGTDAALSAGIMAATLRQFGMGATEATRAADVLTKTANSTFNTVESLGESLKYAGPVAKSLGLSLEDTAAILGVLGNVGIQGSEAGTALRRLGVISAASGDKLKQLFNVDNTDAAGNLKPLVQILDEINDATANMPVAERTKRMAEAFGLLGITSANVLSSTAGGVTDLAAQLRNAEGTAAKAAKEMDAGLGGALRIALSAVEGTALAIGDALAPSLISLVRTIEGVATGLTTFVKANQEMIVQAAKGVAIFSGVGVALIGVGMSLQVVSTALGGFGAAFGAITTLATLFLNPIGLLVVGLGALAAFGPKVAASMQGMFGGVGGMVEGVSASIGGAFQGAVAGAMTVLGDLATTASVTFSGIYAAIAEGDLAGAMDVLWAGLYAGWLRGVESLMNAVDPWISAFQNVFTDVGHYIYIVFDALWTDIAALTRTMGAVIYGAFESLVNPILQRWDDLTTALKTEWINLKALFTVSDSARQKLADDKKKLKDDAAARKKARESGTGVAARLAEAAATNAEEEQRRRERKAAIYQSADDIKAGREGENQRRRDERRAATEAAEGAVSGKSRGKRETQARNQQFTDLLKQIEAANSSDKLTDLYDEFQALASSGRLTSQQSMAIEAAWWKAQNKMSSAAGKVGGAGSSPGEQAAAGAGAAGADAAQSKAEVAGTFSSTNLGGMGFGSSLGERQLKALETIASNTSNMEGPAYAQE